MTDPTPAPVAPGSPPLICQNCALHQIHTPIDVRGISYFCPHVHGGIWATWLPQGRWRIFTAVSVDQYRTILAITEEAARHVTEAATKALSEISLTPDGTDGNLSSA